MKRLAGAALLVFSIPAVGLPRRRPASSASRPGKSSRSCSTKVGHLTGFSIELWQEISRQMNVKSEFLVKPTVQDLLTA